MRIHRVRTALSVPTALAVLVAGSVSEVSGHCRCRIGSEVSGAPVDLAPADLRACCRRAAGVASDCGGLCCRPRPTRRSSATDLPGCECPVGHPDGPPVVPLVRGSFANDDDLLQHAAVPGTVSWWFPSSDPSAPITAATDAVPLSPHRLSCVRRE